MYQIKKIFLTIAVSSMSLAMNAQMRDNLSPTFGTFPSANTADSSTTKNKFPVTGLILPAACITYGFIALHDNGLRKINEDWKKNIWDDHPHKKLHLDNIFVVLPGAGAFALEAFGVKGKYPLKDKAIIYAMTSLLANGTASIMKKSTKSLRPDSTKYNSFPSGHSAQVFASAEFLRMEYKNVSAWYGIAGYAIALTTAYLRTYNNKHWLSDVIAGAGVGIASTKLTYWLYPKIRHWFFKDKPATTMILPTYNQGQFGIGMTHQF
ncbi:MAG: phosphatase PAP2 family protein [Chitinophagaceae bacterium]|nr:phosphatase PAP2 family protein [Chitinophagaceae bacterium]